MTQKVAELIKAGAMAVEASNGNFGDPASGIAKKLRVDYTINGVTISKTVPENDNLTLTAMATPPAIVDAICGALSGAPIEAKLALLRTLRTAGGAKALQTVQAAASDKDEQVKDTALRVVCEWPTTDALPLVAELVKSPPSKTIKVLALRGFVRLVPQQDAPDAQKLESLKDAMAQAERNEEKRLVLSALGNVPSSGSLAVVTSHLENPVLKEEACLAAVAIAEKIVSSHGGEVAAAMSSGRKTDGQRETRRASQGPRPPGEAVARLLGSPDRAGTASRRGVFSVGRTFCPSYMIDDNQQDILEFPRQEARTAAEKRTVKATKSRSGTRAERGFAYRATG